MKSKDTILCLGQITSVRSKVLWLKIWLIQLSILTQEWDLQGPPSLKQDELPWEARRSHLWAVFKERSYDHLAWVRIEHILGDYVGGSPEKQNQ